METCRLVWVGVTAYLQSFLKRLTTPDRAYNLRIVGEEVTFWYKGSCFRGHRRPGTELAAAPWYSCARAGMKRPVKAYDGSGRDVTARVLEFWGPTGDWNAAVGLTFDPALDRTLVRPVTVRYNTGGVQTV